ncbi:DUF3883 domain-containing protein [Sharpea azabuensis]|uniref:DUF3883 domain-containing protein n=1 Tax=Sharpea azabuensis TaxID=322505 RepID=UPI001569BC01|nr:DUF3883 domain-containing protein [Sharpea azabuensis]
MKQFKDIVQEVSSNFLDEAKRSPQLLADMAKMEFYMAESYSERLFIELLQNADDAKSTRIISYFNNGNLYFGNNGKPFDESDLIAISRSGASAKKRGTTIGYRGVGFKSATSISNDILIHSSNTYFSFSKERCAKILGMNSNDVPTVRIPLFVDKIDINIQEDINLLKENGYTTVFVFKNVNIDKYLDEVKNINEGYFLFLNNIYECSFELNTFQDTFTINRFSNLGNDHVEVIHEKDITEWMLVKNRDTCVAFLMDNNQIIPCNEEQSVYHCYLPTLEKSIIACKINADFSTDPSRKHITMDEKTKNSLERISEIFINVFEMAFDEADNGKYKNFLTMYMNNDTLSKMNFYLSNHIEETLKSKKWIKLENGETVSPEKYPILPNTFDIEKPEVIRTIPGAISHISVPKKVYENIDGVDEFMSHFSTEEIELSTISEDLSNISYVKKLNPEIHTQLLTSAIRESKIEKSLNENFHADVEAYIVKTNKNSYDTIENVVDKQEKIDDSMKHELEERLAPSEIRWIQKEVGDDNLIKQEDEDKVSSKIVDDLNCSDKDLTIHIPRWRDAENKCVLIEESMGNKATDVSLRNYGYDIESITPTGEKRYIEVKSVKKDFSFSLTNNEYTTAHEYGENYYICLLLENESELIVHYIQNPLKNATFEKRIRQWEWICLDSESTTLTFELD